MHLCTGLRVRRPWLCLLHNNMDVDAGRMPSRPLNVKSLECNLRSLWHVGAVFERDVPMGGGDTHKG